MSKPLISILIPVYNTEKYLRECLDSVVNQSIENKEVIIVDDGSTDNSPSIIDEYEERYDFVRTFHQDNKGLWEARCKLLSLAEGEFIAWVDSDDYVELDMYEALCNAAINQNVEVVLCNYSFFPGSIKTKEKWFKPYMGSTDWKFIERNTQPWNKVVKRDLLNRIEINKWLPKGGDGTYSLVLINAKGLLSVDKEYYHYRVGHTSMSNNMSNISHFDKNVHWTENQRIAAESVGLSSDWLEYFDYRVIYSVIQAMIIASHNNDKQSYNKYRSKYKNMNPRKNKYTKMVLRSNHGRLKTFVLTNLIPLNYCVAKIISNIAL